MTSRRASIVVAGLLAIVALGWFAWPSETRAPARDREIGSGTEASTAPAPLAAAGREARSMEATDARESRALAGRGTDDGTAAGEAGTASELARATYEQRTAGNVLEVVVLGRPTLDGLECSLEDLRRPGVRQATDRVATREGMVFRFAEVPAGTWRVRVDGPDAASRAWLVSTPQDAAANHRQVVMFGTATLHGTLFDFDGRPLPGHLVRLISAVRGGWSGNPEDVRVRTDASGAYRIRELLAGPYRVVGSVDVVSEEPFDGRRGFASLEAGAVVRCDLGGPTPALRFTLRLTRASGTVARLSPRARGIEVFFEAPTPEARASGRFTGRASRGTFKIYGDGYGLWPHGVLGSIEVVGDGQEFALTVPGVAVEGRVVGEGVGGVVDGRGGDGQGRLGVGEVRLVRAEPDQWGGLKVEPDADGRFLFEAVPPGRATVLFRPLRMSSDGRAASEVSLQIDVPADRDVTGLELRLPAR